MLRASVAPCLTFDVRPKTTAYEQESHPYDLSRDSCGIRWHGTDSRLRKTSVFVGKHTLVGCSFPHHCRSRLVDFHGGGKENAQARPGAQPACRSAAGAH